MQLPADPSNNYGVPYTWEKGYAYLGSFVVFLHPSSWQEFYRYGSDANQPILSCELGRKVTTETITERQANLFGGPYWFAVSDGTSYKGRLTWVADSLYFDKSARYDYDVLVLTRPWPADPSIEAEDVFVQEFNYWGFSHPCPGSFVPDPPPFEVDVDLSDEAAPEPITVPITPEFLAACKPE